MGKAIEAYLQEEKQKNGRVKELKETMTQNESRLPELQKEYKAAVVEDKDNIDDLFQEIETLENKIKADKRKLETLEEATQEHLKDSALKLLTHFYDEVRDKHQGRADKVNAEIHEAKKEYADKIKKLFSEIDGINEDYKKDTKEYEKVMKRNELSKSEVKQIANNLYMDLENGFARNVDAPFKVINAVELDKLMGGQS